jgi:hypothetical protein
MAKGRVSWASHEMPTLRRLRLGMSKTTPIDRGRVSTLAPAVAPVRPVRAAARADDE